MTSKRAFIHLHIGRARKGLPDMLSVKLGTEPTHYAISATLRDVTFTVQPAGRARMHATGQKNVHAGVRGVPCHTAVPAGHEILGTLGGWRRAKYHPMVDETFVDVETGAPVLRARCAYLIGRTVHYLP